MKQYFFIIILDIEYVKFEFTHDRDHAAKSDGADPDGNYFQLMSPWE